VETSSKRAIARGQGLKRARPGGKRKDPGRAAPAPEPELSLRNLGTRSSVPVVKRSVSLDADLDTELTNRFGRGGKSRFLNTAARDALARLLIVELLDRMEEQDGPVPDAIRAEVAGLLRPA